MLEIVSPHMMIRRESMIHTSVVHWRRDNSHRWWNIICHNLLMYLSETLDECFNYFFDVRRKRRSKPSKIGVAEMETGGGLLSKSADTTREARVLKCCYVIEKCAVSYKGRSYYWILRS